MSDFEYFIMIPFIAMLVCFGFAIWVQKRGKETKTSKQPLVSILYIAGILFAIGTIGNIF